MEGKGVSPTKAGSFTFTGSACIVLLLSNRTESSSVKCITASRYATHGVKKIVIQVELPSVEPSSEWFHT